MKVKGIIDEDLVNYKLPSMYIAFPSCTFKCDEENGCQYCQNASLIKEATIEIEKEELIERYLKNNLTGAIVLSGLEPFDSEFDLLPFIDCLRRQYGCKDPVVIYTGYTEEELETGNFGNNIARTVQKQYWAMIKSFGNIVVKFGRFRPGEEPHLDSILGVYLSSNNQYAKEYKNENKEDE